MNEQSVYGTSVKDIASQARLADAFAIQKQAKKPAFYVLPSHLWLQVARQKQPGLLVTTFDDIARYLLKQAGHSYISLSEQERSLFFQQFMKEEGLLDEDVHVGKAQGYADTYGQVKRLGLSLNELPESLASLHSLFLRYENRIVNERKLLDPENVILRAIEILGHTREPVEVSLIIIDGYYDFSPLQALLIEALQKADVKIKIYVPTDMSYEVVENTVKEFVSMGFRDLRKDESELFYPVKKELVAATTAEEQWRGVMESIRLSEHLFEEIGVVVVDERNGMKELERFAQMYDVPISKPKKRPISATSIHAFLLIVIQQTGAPKSKWEQLPLVEHILRLYSVSGLPYAKQKQLFLQTGEWYDEEHEQLFNKVRQLSWNKNDYFIEYLQTLGNFVEQLCVTAYWENQFEVETSVSRLKKMADEYKTWEILVLELQQYKQLLLEKGLNGLKLSIELFSEWFKDIGDNVHLFEKRGSKSGVAIHTWRDVGLFRGEKLFVVGMNEGVFPSPNHLSGYVQERDLVDSEVRFSPPTQAHVRKKQEAHFQQLDYVTKSIIFTYVHGVDPNYPLLPSPLLGNIEKSNQEWSWDTRMKNDYALNERDKEEKVAFHLGKGCVIDGVSPQLETVVGRLRRLTEAEEIVDLQVNEYEPTVSVTALESYARCPFRYAMERVVVTKEPGAEMERVSPLDIGQFIHNIVEEMYTRLDLVGVPFAEGSEETLARAPILLDELFEEMWKLVEQQSHEIARSDLLLTKRQWQKRLQIWWQAERKHFWDNELLANMSIMALEKSIHLHFSLNSGQTMTLTGKADRIDRSPKSFVIYDYKTGLANVKMKEVQSGLKLQLPLYAFAMREELIRDVKQPIVADGATYISLREPSKRSGNGIWRSEHVGKGSSYAVTHHCKNREDTLGTDEFLVKYNLKERIEQLWHGMHTNFPVKPLECSSFCPYRSVCRVTPEQIEENEI